MSNCEKKEREREKRGSRQFFVPTMETASATALRLNKRKIHIMKINNMAVVVKKIENGIKSKSIVLCE